MAIEIVDFPIKDGDPIIMVIIFIPSWTIGWLAPFLMVINIY